MNTAAQLDEAIRKVCPIVGVSIGDPKDKKSWEFHPTEEASQDQVDAALGILQGFVWDDSPDPPEVVLKPVTLNLQQLLDIDKSIDLADFTPTQAAVLHQVVALVRKKS